jgi:hypothetical protein
MLKFALITAALVASLGAYANPTTGAGSVSTSVAQSNSTGGVSTVGDTSSTSAGNSSGNITVGCLVNCADTSQGTKDLADSGITQALINGQTARDVAATTQTIKNTPSVSGPALTTSNDTCMGSTSGSLNIAGLGIGGGTSWVDENCKMLKNSRELWNMGMKAASMALMCNDPANREALELTGYVCPQTARAKAATATDNATLRESMTLAVVPATRSTGYSGTDPIVRARLGLPALK